LELTPAECSASCGLAGCELDGGRTGTNEHHFHRAEVAGWVVDVRVSGGVISDLAECSRRPPADPVVATMCAGHRHTFE
jgi:hypothetical protein